MNLKQIQEKIAEFDKARGWENSWNIKDLLLNITEEGGELWNLIKWVDDEKQKKVVSENIKEVKDYIGDVLFLILKIANQTNIDVEKSINKTLEEYEKRMPSDILKKVGHANTKAGGIDNKNGKCKI